MQLDYSGSGRVLPRASGLLGLVERAGLWVSSAAVVVLGALVIVSISSRVLTGRSIPDDNVMVGDLMVAIVALSWAVVTATRGNIVVEVFTNWMSERAQFWLGALGSLVGLVMIVPLAWASYTMLRHSLLRGTYYDGILAWPQWPARMLFFYAFVLMALRLVLLMADDIAAALGRRTR